MEAHRVHLITKIDESGTHGASPYMIMAGYTARLDQWNRFDIRWRKGLRKADLDYFHAKEHWKHPFTAKVVKLSDSNLLFGFVARMSEFDYKKFYREGDWGGKAQPDSMYGLCFRYCLSLILQQALIKFPKKDFVLDFVVEAGHQNEGAPCRDCVSAKAQENRRGIRVSGLCSFGREEKGARIAGCRRFSLRRMAWRIPP